MTTIRIHKRVAVLVGAAALFLQMSPVMAGGQSASNPGNAPVAITFTKWGAPPPAMPPTPFFGLFQGFSGDGLLGSFEAEVLWRQRSVNGHVTGLEALYEVVDGDRSFSALIRGGPEFDGRGSARGRHPRRVAHRRPGAGRVPAVSRDCRGTQLRRGATEHDVFRGHHPRTTMLAGVAFGSAALSLSMRNRRPSGDTS